MTTQAHLYKQGDLLQVADTSVLCQDGGPPCSDHPEAPHGFNRNASHNAGRYVCYCEGWEPDLPPQEPQ